MARSNSSFRFPASTTRAMRLARRRPAWPPGRVQRRTGIGGAVSVDDTYNANPESVRAAIDVLAATAGHTVLVLGDMGEVGTTSAQLHDEDGGYAKSKGVDE